MVTKHLLKLLLNFGTTFQLTSNPAIQLIFLRKSQRHISSKKHMEYNCVLLENHIAHIHLILELILNIAKAPKYYSI